MTLTKQSPPFRADHVGSLLRSAEVRDARVKAAEGKMSAAELTAIEDAAIQKAIAKQESIGLKSITDGETRRATWHLDFLERLDGVDTVIGEALAFKGATPHKTKNLRVVGKIDFSGHPMLEHFKFLKQHTRATPKMTIPSPTMLFSAMRDWRDYLAPGVYSDLDELYADLGRAYGKAIRAFGDAGCRYLQLDDCNLSYLCDSSAREKMAARGDDPDRLLDHWSRLINSALAERPAGMIVSTHICRGNFRSTWMAQGGYEAIADTLFNRIDYDGYFLEYDSDRAGGFEPLRFVPKSGNKHIVLGLVTSKTGELENKEDIKRRIEHAAQYVDLNRLCLSPQCGFASTEEGNLLAEQQQWAKLARVVEISREVWQDA
jgi:5-methyltetrahydropteroyltriglutamate--homocysteine methyltransferase